MFKKIFVFLAFMFPFSVFASNIFITNEDNYLYTVKYKVCTGVDRLNNCNQWGPVNTVQVGPTSGSSVSFQANPMSPTAVSLVSVTDEKNNAISGDTLVVCSSIASAIYNSSSPILTLFHLGDRVACKSGGFTKK